MQIETLQLKTAVNIEPNPFLFERVTLAKAPDQDDGLARPGWCACGGGHGHCNCFCGSCAACSITPSCET